MRFTEHDFIGCHASFALRHTVEFNFNSHAATRAHLAGRAGQACSAHVLYADDRAGLHGFKARFEQQLLQKRITHLDVGPLGLRAFAEFFAGHGGAMDAVAPGLGADVNDRIAFAGGTSIENLVAADESQGEGVYQGIIRVATLEFGFSAEVRDAEAVAVRSDAAYYAFEKGMILVDFFCGRRWRVNSRGRGRPRHIICDGAEAQGIHYCYGARAHGEDVAQYSPDAGGCALKGLDERRVIVRLDFEGAGPTVSNVDDAGVLAGSLNYQAATCGQTLQMNAGGFVGAMLAPHHAEDAELCDGGLASAKQLLDFFVRVRRKAMFPDEVGSDGRNRRSGHMGKFYCRIW